MSHGIKTPGKYDELRDTRVKQSHEWDLAQDFREKKIAPKFTSVNKKFVFDKATENGTNLLKGAVRVVQYKPIYLGPHDTPFGETMKDTKIIKVKGPYKYDDSGNNSNIGM
jgi:hypothetical protein